MNGGDIAGDEDYHEYTEKFFARWAPVYNVMEILASGVRKKAASLVAAPSGTRILDVATGTGRQAFAFAGKGLDVTGVDISGDMLRIAIRDNRYPDARFFRADATALPFRDGLFDAGCISFALHDMPLDARRKALAELLRVTKSDGTLIVVDYALPEGRARRWLIYRLIRAYESRYYPEFVGSDLRGLLSGAGVEIKRSQRVLMGAGVIVVAKRVIRK